MNLKERIPTPRFSNLFIPMELLEMETLSLRDIMLLSVIDALYCEELGGCVASNEFLASQLHVKASTIARSLSYLRKLNLVEDSVPFDGRVRVINSVLHENIA